MGPRVYTVEEANCLVPRLEESFRSLDALRERMRGVKFKMNALEMIWGEAVTAPDNPDRREYQHHLDGLKSLGEEFAKLVAEFEAVGAVLKGLDQGLIDFYGVKDGRLVFLCWQRGETEIAHWHHIDEGFSGRHPLDAPVEET